MRTTASPLLALFASAVGTVAAYGCSSDPVGGGNCPSPAAIRQTITLEAGTTFDGGGFEGGAQEEECRSLCGDPSCAISADGKTVGCYSVPRTSCIGGRRPQGLSALDQPHTLGAYFASMALLESASIRAFRVMTGELARLGAPRRLVQAARRARRDEVRHTALTRTLARRFGSTPKRPASMPTGVRALVDIAIENAVEGCVRETYGAVIAHWQASHAEDPQVRSTMALLARDETQHSALAWRTHAWLSSKLTEEDRRRVESAMRDAVTELSQQADPPYALRHTAGMPSQSESAALVAVLNERLWRQDGRARVEA